MDTPESLVYRGREGTGAAQIFGREGNPMGAYKARKNEVAQKRAQQAEAEKLDKQKRDKQLWEAININPDKAYQPFNDQVKEAANNVRSQVVKYNDAGGNLDDLNFKLQQKKGWDEVNDLAGKSNYIKSTIDETQKLIKDNPYLNAEYYYPKIWDKYMDAKGNGKPLKDVNAIEIQNIYNDDPMGFDGAKYTEDFVKNVKDNVISFIEQKNVNGGILTVDTKAKVTGDLYTIDPATGEPTKDDDGNPILNVTKDFAAAFTQSKAAKAYFNAVAEKEGVDVKSVIERFVRPQAKYEKDLKASFSREPASFQKDFDKQAKATAAATDRYTKLAKVLVNPFDDKGQPTQDAQAVIGNYKNAKYLDGNIVDIQLVKGTSTPGTFDFHGQPVSNAASNRLVFTVKTSDKGRPKVMEVNLNSPEALEALNGMHNNSPSETDKFSTNDITQLTGKNLNDLYSTTNNDAPSLEDQARVETDAVNRVMKTPIGKDAPDIVGKTIDGKKIIGAKKIETAQPHSVFGVTLGTWGQKDAVEVELADGTVKEITDPEEIRKIVKGEPIKLKAAYKSPDGKTTFTVKDLKAKYNYTDEEIQQAIDEGKLK
ncbi:MAG: hypothetical protein WKF87_06730 [Chryseolinea sp.]